MTINKDTLISDIVAKNYKAASIFDQHEIDFCCNGNRSLATACENLSLNVDDLIIQLAGGNIEKEESDDYASWDIDFLADYIYNKHHKYVEKAIPEIKQYLDKVCSVHGSQHPELLEINTLFTSGTEELLAHMQKEEMILFPYFKELVTAAKNKTSMPDSCFGKVENPIAMMHHEHNNEGERYRKIAALSNNYTTPVDACATYKVTYSMLEEFNKDIHKHIHLENNILFKNAIALEKTLMNQ